MVRLIVDPGACGFTCKVEVDKVGNYQATINVQSQCKQIKKLANELTEIDFLEISQGRTARITLASLRLVAVCIRVVLFHVV